ncbi:MAG: hypothetical protein ACPIA2_12435 [Mariniblastus sp.]
MNGDAAAIQKTADMLRPAEHHRVDDYSYPHVWVNIDLSRNQNLKAQI